MALRKLDEASSRTIELSASVCIVGAGIAGLVAATRLARDKKRRIVVVESGHGEFKPSGSPDGSVQRFGWYIVALGRKTPSS